MSIDTETLDNLVIGSILIMAAGLMRFLSYSGTSGVIEWDLIDAKKRIQSLIIIAIGLMGFITCCFISI